MWIKDLNSELLRVSCKTAEPPKVKSIEKPGQQIQNKLQAFAKT
jgi:hypothetical protein